MSNTLTTGSLKAIFRFPFEQEGWQQAFLIGSGLIFLGFFIPILPLLFVAGYMARLLRRAIQDGALALPAWADWGQLGLEGLRVTSIALLYMLPGIVVYGAGMALYFATFLMFPVMFGLANESNGLAIIWPLISFGSMAMLFLSVSVGSALFIAGIVPLPMATAHAVAEDRFGAAFRVREWGRMLRRNRLEYFITWVIIAGLTMIVYVGMILLYYSLVLCALVPFIAAPVLFYVWAMHSALFGLTYRESRTAA